LQAGNLVKENKKSFVLLNESGRAEIPKKDIMFINGKTLQQWQEKPDKLFQTEIIPDEIPNPGYVNDKAALPIPVKPVLETQPLQPLESVLPVKKSATNQPMITQKAVDEEEIKETIEEVETQADLVETKPKKAEDSILRQKSVVTSDPPKTESEPIKLKRGVTHFGSSEKVQEREGLKSEEVAKKGKPKKKRQRGKTKKHVEDDVALSNEQSKEAKVEKKEKPQKKTVKRGIRKKKKTSWEKKTAWSKKFRGMPRRPWRFSREKYGDYHYKRAKVYNQAGERGKTLQELHYATVLNRRNAEGAFLLGKIYMEEGVFDRAKKILKHPGLKKREEVKTMIGQMDSQAKEKKKAQWMLIGSTSAGALSFMPLIFLMRRMRKSKPIREKTVSISPPPTIGFQEEKVPVVKPTIQDVLERLSEDEDLAETEKKDVQDHLRDCEDCRNEEHLLVSSWKSLDTLDEIVPTTTFRGKVLLEIEKEKNQGFWVFPLFQQLGWRGPVLASVTSILFACLIGITGGISIYHSQLEKAPSITTTSVEIFTSPYPPNSIESTFLTNTQFTRRP
ncbi:hypothetical protein BVX98_03900, partial [bacterium F11]